MAYIKCTHCIMDTSDPQIVFNNSGRCNHCIDAELLYKNNRLLHDKSYRDNELKNLVNKIKSESKERL